MVSNKNGKDLKLFLFDLEGVLVPKNISEDSKILEKSLLVIKKYFSLIKSSGYSCGIVTLRKEDALIEELRKLSGCFVITSLLDKVTPVEKIIAELGLGFKNVFYMGDDMFDIPLLQKSGFSASPSNAHKEVKRIVDVVITYAVLEDLFSYIINEIMIRDKE